MAPVNLRGSLVAALIAGQLFLPLHTLPVQAEPVEAADGHAQSAETAQPQSSGVNGYATYYAKRYNGRKTTSGVRYNPEKLTAAHSTLPFGTRVRVLNPANSKEVVVTVNDRCKKRKTPHIDLSRAAAKELGFLGKGLVKVQIIPLEEEAG
jgi:rare lipoprotein A